MLEISSPGVSPSNSGKPFPNLARQQDPPIELRAEVTAICEAELQAAGIRVEILPEFISRGEVPSRAVGFMYRWKFERAWYYWRAEGPGIPIDAIKEIVGA